MNFNDISGPAYHVIFDSADVGLALIDREGAIALANTEWLRLTGLRAEDVVGRPVGQFFPEAADLPLLVTACLYSGSTLRLPRRYRMSGRRACWWEGSVAPVRIAAQPYGLLRIAEVSHLVPAGEPASDDTATSMLATMIDAVPIALALVEGDTLRMRWANAGFRNLIDDRTELPPGGAPIDALLPWAAESGLVAAVQQVVAEPSRSVVLHYQIPSGDRDVSYWRWSAIPLPVDEDRHEVLLLGVEVAGGVLETWQLEEVPALTERRLSRLESVFSSMNEGLFIADSTGRVLAVNAAAARILGFPDPQALRRYLHQHRNDLGFRYTDGSPVPREEMPIERAIRGEAFTNLELRVRLRDSQTEIIGSFSGAGVRDAADRVALAILTLRDVTTERSIEFERQFLHEVSRVAVNLLDLDQTLAQVVQLAVPTIADWCSAYVFGTEGGPRRVAYAHADPVKAALATELEQRFPVAGETVAAIIERSVTSGRTQVVSPVTAAWLRQRFPDREYRTMVRKLGTKSIIVIPLTPRGEPVGALLLGDSTDARSITPERIALAEEFGRRTAIAIDNARLYQLARDAIAERDVFLSVAAHELRSPVTSLRGFTQVARRLVGSTSPNAEERLAHALDVVNIQADKLVRLVTQLLEVSRIETGRVAIQREPVDLVALVANAVSNAQARAERSAISVESPPTLVVPVDPMRIEQVMTNLLDNAIKFSPEDSPILVAVRARPPGWVEITVEDRGPGIAPEHRPHIFERFYQIQTGGTQPGMGLGLYISRQIVELHQGRISAELPPEGGARIVIRLPIQPEEPAE